jgi:ADP-ribosylglycohydrolase
MTDPTVLRTRLESALWGLFAADALAMPVHWFYSRDNIRQEFDGGVTGYEAARHPHPEAFMIGMGYRPDVEAARAHDRPYDILGDHARFYDTTDAGPPAIDLTDTEGEHGNAVASAEHRYHYHHGLAAGENTLGAHLVRVLLRSVAACGGYDQDDFLARFVDFMTGTKDRRDPYTEIYLRRWFENYALGLPPAACAEYQRNVWSIGSHGGMIRPLVVGLLGARDAGAYQAVGMALEHQNLTHRSENVAAAVAVAVPLLHDLVRGGDARDTLQRHAARVRPPAVNGHDLFKAYRDHGGPGGIPDADMWRLHTELADDPLDLAALDAELPEDEVVMGRFATACYPEHGLPLSLYLAYHHAPDARAALLANANAGGDNVHRGMVLGLIAGAACDGIPDDLRDGLADGAALAVEIEAFVEVACSTHDRY